MMSEKIDTRYDNGNFGKKPDFVNSKKENDTALFENEKANNQKEIFDKFFNEAKNLGYSDYRAKAYAEMKIANAELNDIVNSDNFSFQKDDLAQTELETIASAQTELKTKEEKTLSDKVSTERPISLFDKRNEKNRKELYNKFFNEAKQMGKNNYEAKLYANGEIASLEFEIYNAYFNGEKGPELPFETEPFEILSEGDKEISKEDKIKQAKKVAVAIRQEREDYYKGLRDDAKDKIKNLNNEIKLLNSQKPKKADFSSMLEYEKELNKWETKKNELEAEKKKTEKELAESREEISELRDMKKSKLTKNVNTFLSRLTLGIFD